MYKLRRLPGSPLWELEQTEELATEIVSSLKDCLGWKGDEPLQRMEEPGLTDIWPPRSKTPRRGRKDTSTERGLIKAREAHWKTLATAAALEEEIVIELVCHLGPVGGLYPLQEPGSPQLKISGMEQEAPLGAAGGDPCPFL